MLLETVWVHVQNLLKKIRFLLNSDFDYQMRSKRSKRRKQVGLDNFSCFFLQFCNFLKLWASFIVLRYSAEYSAELFGGGDRILLFGRIVKFGIRSCPKTSWLLVILRALRALERLKLSLSVFQVFFDFFFNSQRQYFLFG